MTETNLLCILPLLSIITSFMFDSYDDLSSEFDVLDEDFTDWMSTGVVEEFDSETLAMLKEF